MNEDSADEVPRLQKRIARLERQVRQLNRALVANEDFTHRLQHVAHTTRRDLEQKVDETQEMAAALQEAVLRANAASDAKSQFLAVMSHELRTPLNGIVGSTEMLRESKMNVEQADLVRLIHMASGDLLQVINDILDFSRVEAGEMVLEQLSFDPALLLEDVAGLYRSGAERNGVTIEVVLGSGVPAFVLGDARRLRQIIQNLTNNAVKFTRSGRIVLSMDWVSGMATVSVADTGPGIAADVLPTLFEPFTQADATVTRIHGGSGLGLAIVHGMSVLMNGSVRVESELGRGSKFVVEIPLALAATSKVAADGELMSMHDDFDARILVVDDHSINRVIMERMLRRIGCRVQCVDSGAASIEAVKHGGLDLVFMDCSMPGMTGWEATRLIRKMDEHLPIIAMTANILPEHVQQSHDAGMNAHLEKPVMFSALRRVLQKYLVATSAPA